MYVLMIFFRKLLLPPPANPIIILGIYLVVGATGWRSFRKKIAGRGRAANHVSPFRLASNLHVAMVIESSSRKRKRHGTQEYLNTPLNPKNKETETEMVGEERVCGSHSPFSSSVRQEESNPLRRKKEKGKKRELIRKEERKVVE